MMRRLQLVSMIALFVVASSPLLAASGGSVSGVIRDSNGVPQMGAVVQLLRPDMSVLASAYTSSKGTYTFADILPGKYAIKAMGALFLPSLRENVRVRANTVVNLTLNTLYEVMQWLPAESRAANAPGDDWEWTLRSAANRPLLRWLEDGPLVVVSDRPGARPKLKARLMASGQEGTFGESGERFTASVEDTPSDSRELLARVDFAPDTDAGMESMLGFRQDLGFAGAVESMAAISIHPVVEGSGGEGLDEAAMRGSEKINLGDEFEIDAGAQQVMARFSQNSPNTILETLPFATIAWHGGNSTVSYRMATAPSVPNQDESRAGFYLPRVSMHDGQLALEHGFHQEIGWERRTDASGVSFLVFSDNTENPVIQASGRFGNNYGVLSDPMSGLMRAAGQSFSSAGVMAAVEHRVAGGNRIRVSYANGDALVMPASVHPTALSQVFSAAKPHHAQMYAISLSGKLDGTGTRWRASYRWQPADTVTSIAQYSVGAIEPYLNLHLRQSIGAHHDGLNVEALLDVNNMLAQGYRPYLVNGSMLVFAQDQRSIGAGVAFTF
ncbi:carboxypeptidase-like regulatory domain-containing protein [Telmatobacter sp. DSM 110680]|uniref:Carboxypeptidase-like regulatory domain-containing protein n=1 Tax=Telmatobacter sp. DSM 110680 TaxID=3036704 RepID=A0AAU7DRW4_9BACT